MASHNLSNPVNRDGTTVLIVGAGPVGLSAALALRQSDVAVRIVDAGEDVDKRMRASTFHPPTLDMIASLGVADELIEQGLIAPQFQMRQHESNEQVTFDLSAISDVTAHPFRLQVEQHRYCTIVIDALSKLGVAVEFGKAVQSITADEIGATAHLEDAEIRADWMVGADGANSAVRKSLGLDYGGKTYTHSSVLISVDFPFHEYLDGLSSVTYCWSERGPFSLLRLRDIWRASLYPGVEDLDAAADECRVREWLAYIHPAARDAEILQANPYRVHERCVNEFRVGRVLLAGDAAHLNPPSGGMGMNGGIHDAINLSEKLLDVLGGAADSVLDRYSRQRQTLASKRIIPQAAANRARMATMDKSVQLERLRERRQIAADPAANREFLLLSSMLTSVREAQEID